MLLFCRHGCILYTNTSRLAFVRERTRSEIGSVGRCWTRAVKCTRVERLPAERSSLPLEVFLTHCTHGLAMNRVRKQCSGRLILRILRQHLPRKFITVNDPSLVHMRSSCCAVDDTDYFSFDLGSGGCKRARKSARMQWGLFSSLTTARVLGLTLSTILGESEQDI